MIYICLRFAYRSCRYFLVQICRLVFHGFVLWGPPVGAFSALALLRAGKLKGEILFEGQKLPSFAKKSVTVVCHMGQEAGQPWPFFWCRLHRTRLVGPSLCPLNSNKEIMVESAYGSHFYKEDPSYNYLHLPAPKRLGGTWSSVACRWDRGYYHWLMDVLPRTACSAYFPPSTRFLARGPAQPFQLETLRWLGLEERFAFTEHDHYVVDDYYYAGLAGMSGCVNPWKVIFLRDRLGGMALHERGQGENLYIVRRGKTRGIINGQEVEDFFRARGWVVVDTEQLTVAQQAGLFVHARQICTVHGAALTNLLWAGPGTRILELLPDNFLNGVYEGLAMLLGLNYSYRIYRGDRRCRITVPLQDLASWVRSSPE